MSKRAFVVRTVSDWIGPHGVTTVFEVRTIATDEVVMRSYSKRDAACEARYRNKWNPDGDTSGTSRNIT